MISIGMIFVIGNSILLSTQLLIELILISPNICFTIFSLWLLKSSILLDFPYLLVLIIQLPVSLSSMVIY